MSCPDSHLPSIQVASLASFYADSTRTEDFFTGSEREDSEDADEDVRDFLARFPPFILQCRI